MEKKQPKKMGRPTENPRIHNCRIRMSDVEWNTLDKCCELTGLNKADVIRKGINMVYDSIKK